MPNQFKFAVVPVRVWGETKDPIKCQITPDGNLGFYKVGKGKTTFYALIHVKTGLRLSWLPSLEKVKKVALAAQHPTLWNFDSPVLDPNHYIDIQEFYKGVLAQHGVEYRAWKSA